MKASIFALSTTAALGLATETEQSTGSPIDSVLKMLVDLRTEVETEGKNTQANYQEYVQIVAKEAREYKNTIDRSTEKVDECTAAHQDATAKEASAEGAIAEAGAAGAAKQKESVDAKSIRDEEHALYEKTEAEAMEISDQLSRAIPMLKRASEGGVEEKKRKLWYCDPQI